ncbi:MAG: HNH endonuclease [Thermoanaerobaculia bacterium]|nr:HNH endonuclease [Thermoanaerobaculia bacterium]
MSATYVPIELRRRVAAQARHRCGYCLSQESVLGCPMEIDHLFPRSLGGATTEDNLWLACSVCNAHKNNRCFIFDPKTGANVRIFNPRSDVWSAHFEWGEGGIRIDGRTAAGRATVAALRLNRPSLVLARKLWIRAGWHPPQG